MVRRATAAVALGAVLLVAGALAYPFVPATLPATGEAQADARVTVRDAGTGAVLGVVDARVADTPGERYTGLSDTASLPPDEGMLFVYPEEGRRAFVMREMSFPLDIVFVGANGTITAVHHAPVPSPGTTEDDLERYRGRAKWVLEVNRGWTTDRGVGVGDRVDVSYAA